MVTAAGIGLFSSIEDAVENMVKIDQVFTPDPEVVDMYQSFTQGFIGR